MVRPFKIPLKRKNPSPLSPSRDSPDAFFSNDDDDGDDNDDEDASAVATRVVRARTALGDVPPDFAELVNMSLSTSAPGANVNARCASESDRDVVEATHMSPRALDDAHARVDEDAAVMDSCRHVRAMDAELTRAEHAKRVSDGDALRALVRALSDGVSGMVDSTMSRRRATISDATSIAEARRLSIRMWNFAIEKTALATHAASGKITVASLVAPLLSLRALSCELMDRALGYPDTMRGRASVADVVTAMLNHTTVATLLYDDERFKDAEEQFLMMESYGNYIVNERYELDDEALLRVFEAMTTRAKNAFRMGNVDNARDFFQAAAQYFQSRNTQHVDGRSADQVPENDAICAMTLANAKINLAETLASPPKTSVEAVRLDHEDRIKYLIDELESSYAELYKFVPNSWSTSTQVDNAALFTLDESLMRKDAAVLRSDGLYIRALHYLAQLYISSGRYADALLSLEKMKVIKSFLKTCKKSDSVVASDAEALTGGVLMDNMFVEAFSGVGETSKASEVLESMLSDEMIKADVLRSCCVKLAASDHGAIVIVANISALTAKLRSHPTETRRDILTDVFDGLLHTITTTNDEIAEEITHAFERVLSDGNLIRDIGFSGDGKSRAYSIIWNAAVEMYMQGKYALARRLFGMAIPLCSQHTTQSSVTSLVAIIRLQIMCDLEVGDLPRARESFRGLLSQYPKGKDVDVATQLLQIKIQIASKDFSGLEDSITSFAQSGESDALLYVAGELNRGDQHTVAATAFRKLYAMFLDDSCSIEMHEQESFIFCSYLNHLQASKANEKGVVKFDKSTMTSVVEMFQAFAARINKQSSLLNDEDQAKFLADYSWNIGLDAYSIGYAEGAYQFMFVCALIVKKLLKAATVMEAERRDDYTFRQASALLLAIASLTSGEHASALQGLSQNDREDARKARDAQNITRSKQAMAQLRGILDAAVDGRMEELKNIALVLEYEIACAEKNVALQRKLIDGLVPKDTNGSSVTTLLLIADRGCQLRSADVKTVARAYEELISAYKKQAVPNFRYMSRVMRKRIEVCSRIHRSDDAPLLALYAEAEKLYMEYGNYSAVEAQWLVATSFNRAVRHERSMRPAQALSWLEQTNSLLCALDGVLPNTSDFRTLVLDNIAMLSAELDTAVAMGENTQADGISTA